MELQPKIIREEYFPFLVINGYSVNGIVQWLDYGHYFKIKIKDEEY